MACKARLVTPRHYHSLTHWQLAFQLDLSSMTLTILLECAGIRWVDVAGEETSLLGLLSTERHCAE